MAETKMKLTDREARFVGALDAAIARGGMVDSHRAVNDDGWFFPIDLFLGAGTVASSLFRKGVLERREAGGFRTRWMYRRKR